MYSLGVTDHIMVAHRLADPAFGRAQRLHGATFVVELELRVGELSPLHVVIDIGLLKKILREVLDPLDYANLDEHPAFERVLSTAERVAEYIASSTAKLIRERVEGFQSRPGDSLRVLLRESPVAYAGFELRL